MKTTPLEIEAHEIEPAGFSPNVHVAACYLEIDKKLLVLQCSPGKLEAGKWGVPAGKLEQHETPREAAIRELFEETGISIEQSDHMQCLGALYMRKPEIDYVYHLFKIAIDRLPSIRLSDEHQDYKWVSFEDLQELPLMTGAKQGLQRYQQMLLKKRPGAIVNCYLILRRDHKILLQLRQNTGYGDGQWSLIAGHVEEGESATEAMIREAQEEIDLYLSSAQIQVAHIMHRRTNRLNVDVFFDCKSWEGAIQNLEPEKCEDLQFFFLKDLPSNMIDYNKLALQSIANNQFYSELGWNE